MLFKFESALPSKCFSPNPYLNLNFSFPSSAQLQQRKMSECFFCVCLALSQHKTTPQGHQPLHWITEHWKVLLTSALADENCFCCFILYTFNSASFSSTILSYSFWVKKKPNQHQTQNMWLNVTIIELSSLKTSFLSNQALRFRKKRFIDASAETVNQKMLNSSIILWTGRECLISVQQYGLSTKSQLCHLY